MWASRQRPSCFILFFTLSTLQGGASSKLLRPLKSRSNPCSQHPSRLGYLVIRAKVPCPGWTPEVEGRGGKAQVQVQDEHVPSAPGVRYALSTCVHVVLMDPQILLV
ncbi:hypothetical protein V8C40DRAFT_188086 [Trichoderma camerunense]